MATATVLRMRAILVRPERTLLRMGMYELTRRIDVPYKVVINEEVALAKKFGATDSHKYVNGVLDKAARQIRKVEIAAAS